MKKFEEMPKPDLETMEGPVPYEFVVTEKQMLTQEEAEKLFDAKVEELKASGLQVLIEDHITSKSAFCMKGTNVIRFHYDSAYEPPDCSQTTGGLN